MAEIVSSAEELAGEEKVATLDLGGTLVRRDGINSVHHEINQGLGMTKEEDSDIYMRHLNPDTGDIEDYTAHAWDQTAVLQGKEEADIDSYVREVSDILDRSELVEGAREFVRGLEDQGFTTMVLSSSPTRLAKLYAERLETDYVYDWKRFEFDEGGDFRRVYVNPEAETGKGEVIESLKGNAEAVLHFGDGANDIGALEEADGGVRYEEWISEPEAMFRRAVEEASAYGD